MSLQADVSQLKAGPRSSRRWQPGSGWRQGLGAVGLVVLLWSGYVLAGRPVTLVIEGRPHPLRTHQVTVAAMAQALGLTLAAEDIVRPAPESLLQAGDTIEIQLAQPVTIEADGRTYSLLTQNRTAAAVLAEAGIPVNPRDEILVDGQVAGPGQAALTLPRRQTGPAGQNGPGLLLAALTPRGALAAARPERVRLVIHRAVPVTLYDGQISNTFYTTRPNVGEALLEQGLTLFLGDKVTPGLGVRLSPGMRIYIQRSTPVAISVDGRQIKTRTLRRTVAELLAQEGIALMGQDFSRPPLDTPISAGEVIEVVRVREELLIEQKFISFETSWIPDETLELDRQEVRQDGQTGVIKTRTRLRYENGRETWRGVEDEWMDQEPRNRVIAYGAKIVVRTLDTPDGPVEYWRKISMLATPYSAATSGKERDHPRYGVTRSGLMVGFGMAAVDPKVIPLLTNLYVPGYGPALAADTGGLILGKRIDLAFNEDQVMPDLYKWLDVYVLTPVPPADQIRYVLPEWPQR